MSDLTHRPLLRRKRNSKRRKGSNAEHTDNATSLPSISHVTENVNNLNLNPTTAATATPKNSNSTTKTTDKNNKAKPVEKMFFPHLSKEDLKRGIEYGIIGVGVLRINAKMPFEAYIAHSSGENDILVDGIADRNRAMDGDEVYFALKFNQKINFKNENSRLEGVVLAIKTYGSMRNCVGVLDKYFKRKNGFARFVPTDHKFPCIRVPIEQVPEEYWKDRELTTKMLHYAQITEWENTNYAKGRLLGFIGELGTFQGEINSIILANELLIEPYPDHFNKYFPSLPYSIPPQEINKRLDYRSKCTFTIDPETAKDLDDALSVEFLPDQSVEIGVHISDVTHFLKENTELDYAVAERATSVYLVHTVFHMLPQDLCTLCSLTPGTDKLTFSVIFTFSPDGELINKKFARTVINSCVQLSYEHAQAILERKDVELPPIQNGQTKANIISSIWVLNKFAEKMRKERFDSGALYLDKVEIRFSINDAYEPLSYKRHKSLPSHRLIEEFMLLANMTVAGEISRKYPKEAFLRCHAEPALHPLKRLQASMEKYGILLDVSSSKALQNSLNKLYNGSPEDQAKFIVICYSLTKPMKRAFYYCGATRETEKERLHYALNVPVYTHFTSPIRRYADIMVHRLLAASLDGSSAATPPWDVSFIENVAKNCNFRKNKAKGAEDSSRELFFKLYVSKYGPLIYEAVVFSISRKYTECILLETGIQCKLNFENITGIVETIENEDSLQLKVQTSCEKEPLIIDIFSVLTVVVYCVDNKLMAQLLIK